MKVFECIKEIIGSNKEKLTGTEMFTYIENIFPRSCEWMLDNFYLANRLNGIVLNDYVCSSCKIGVLNTFLIKDPLNVYDKIVTHSGDKYTRNRVQKMWDRYIDGNSPTKSSCLDIAVLTSIVIANGLRDSQEKRFRQYYDLLKTLFEEIDMDVSSDVLISLIPWNYEAAYTRWMEVIEQTDNKLEIDVNNSNKEIKAKLVGREPKQFYEILCVLLYIFFRYKALKEKDKRHFCDQWKRYLESIVTNNTYNDLQSADQRCEIKKKLFGETENGSQKTVAITKSENNHNELGRDPKFLRQSNLYYEVDMKAINKVLNDFSRPEIVVLDLGCGDGKVTFSRFGDIPSVKKIVAIDSDEKQILSTKNLFDSNRNTKLIAETLDMNEDEFIFRLKDVLRKNHINQVDIIFAALSLHNVKDPESLIGILSYEVLAPGGYFIIREVEDETKIYYSKDVSGQNHMISAANDYKKLFGFTDRNAARKMYSWLVNQDFHNIELFYDIIDTCNRSNDMKEDIFNITMGFRKYRAEKYYENLKYSEIAKDVLAEYEELCTRIVNANNKMLTLFKRPDFWFCFTNYVAIGKKPIEYKSIELKRDIEIYLVRHAHCDYDNKNKSHKISAMGKNQINELEIRLNEVSFDTVYCSTYNRAIKTAEPIARTHNLIIHNYPELNEIDRGKVPSDMDWEENKELYSLWKKHKTDMAFPDGESGTSAWLRAKYVIDRIRNEVAVSGVDSEEPYRVCIVTHGGLIRTIICGLLGLPQTCRYQLAEKIDNCSISMLRIRKDAFKNPNTDYNVTLETLNDTSHLSENV